MPTFLCGKPLKFGDKEQIAAINEIEEGARKKAAREELIEQRKFKRYSVTMTITQEIYADVEAVDEEHAIELALKNTGYRRCDIEDIDVYKK